MSKKVLTIITALPYKQDDVLYKLITEMRRKNIESDLYAAILPEDGKFYKYYPQASLFSNIHKNLEKALTDGGYEAVVFNSEETIPVFYEKVRSLLTCRTILFTAIENGKINDVKFDLQTGKCEDVLNLLAKDYDPPKKLTSIIMLTFNQISLTKQCLESLEKHTNLPWELIVVDNGSNDGTPEYIKEYKNKSKVNVKYIFNENNIGFAKANNQGIKIAEGDYMLLLNNDVILTDNWLERLTKCAESIPESGLVGPCTNSAAGSQKTTPGYKDIGDLQKFAAGFSMKNTGRWIDCHRLNAFCFLIKREVIERVGLLDERFGPGGFEDYDYCLRVRQAGYRILLAGDTYIHHIGGQGYENNNLDYNELRSVNKQIFIDKWCRKALEIMEIMPDG